MAQKLIILWMLLFNCDILNKKLTLITTLGLPHNNTTLVGDLPRKVENFKCRSYNLDILKCTFTSLNAEPVKYRLTYEPVESNNIHACKLIEISKSEYECKVEGYRFSYKHFKFTLDANNSAGNMTQIFSFNNYDNVILNKPQIIVQNITPSRAKITWKETPSILDIMYEIKLRPMDHNETWKNLVTTKFHQSRGKTVLNLNSLYANTHYLIRVRMKVRNATDLPEMWSEADQNFTTLAKKPNLSPEIDIGSYYIDDDRKLHIFWKTIPWFERNGEDFRYAITNINKVNPLSKTKPTYSTSYTTEFTEIHEGDYEFTVRSRNEKGFSHNRSTIRVLVPSKVNITREYLKQRIKSTYNESAYKLEWTLDEIGNIANYSVFSCISKQSSFLKCEDDSFNITHIPKNQTSIIFEKQNYTLHFSISFNFVEGSSGMIIPMCSVSEDAQLPLLNLHMVPQSTSIKLEWNLNCEQRTIAKGYVLKYCESDDEQFCNIIRDIPVNQTEYVLENLKPFTNYQIIMAISTGTLTQGQFVKIVQTMEAAPSPPQNLKICERSSNSLVLDWERPKYPNGIIKYYEIRYNNATPVILTGTFENTSRISYTLQNLKSYHEYRISVFAVTMRFLEKLPGERSNNVITRTKVGPPGEVTRLFRNETNSRIYIEWSKPIEITSAINPTYELQVNEDRISTANTSIELDAPSCSASDNFNISIRAVNEVPIEYDEYPGCAIQNLLQMKNRNEMSSLYGNWTQVYSSYCPAEASNLKWIIPLTFILFILSIVGLFLLYRKRKNMSNLRIILPPGLKDIFEEQNERINQKNYRNKFEIEPLRSMQINPEEFENKKISDNSRSDFENSYESINAIYTSEESERVDQGGYNNQQGHVIINGYVQCQSLQNETSKSIIFNFSIHVTSRSR